MKIKYFCYILLRQGFNKPIYVGACRWPKNRLSVHKSIFGKKGINVEMKIIKEFPNKAEALAYEAFLIRRYKKIYKEIFNVIIPRKDYTPYVRKKYDKEYHKRYYKYKKIDWEEKRARNKNKKPVSYAKYYKPRIQWVFLTESERLNIFPSLYWGEYSKISRASKYNTERIRQVFIKKPKKLHPDLYLTIKNYIETRI